MKSWRYCSILILSGIALLPVNAQSRIDSSQVIAAQPDSLTAAHVVAYSELIRPIPGGYAVSVSDLPVSADAKALDILKILPSLRVQNHSIAMDGRSGIKVFIDGRPVRMSGQMLADYMNSVPAGSIRKIEVQTLPAADQDAAGNVGIIRITRHPNLESGWRGNLSASLGLNSYLSGMGSAFLEYTGDRTFINSTFSFDRLQYLRQSRYSADYPSGLMTVNNPMRWQNRLMSGSISAGWHLSGRDLLIVDVRVPVGTSKVQDIDNTTCWYDTTSPASEPASTLYAAGNTAEKTTTQDYSLYYRHDFPSGTSWSSTAGWLTRSSHRDRTFRSHTETDGIILPDLEYASIGSFRHSVFTARTDIVIPLDRWRISTGAKLSSVTSEARNTFSSDSVPDGNFDYAEQIAAIYLSTDVRLRRWMLYAGLRAEYTMIQTEYDNRYKDLFPSVSLTRFLGKTWSVSLQHSNRISRPSFSALNPFRWYQTPYSYSLGNPYLKPSRIRITELSLMEGRRFKTDIDWTRQKGQVGSLVLLDSEQPRFQVEQYGNFLDTDRLSWKLYYLFQPGKRYTAIARGNFDYEWDRVNDPKFPSSQGFGGFVRLTQIFQIGQTLSLTLDLSDRLPGFYSYRKRNNSFQMDLTCQYIHTPSGLIVSLEATDLFRTADSPYSYISDGVTLRYDNKFDTRSLMLTISWRFGNWKKRTPQSLSSNSEEAQRL